jgi:uncharacterized membrane protein
VAERNTAAQQPVRQTREIALDEVVGYILLTGVLLSLALITAGLLWHLADTGKIALDYRITGMNMAQFTVTEFRLALGGGLSPRLCVNLGIVILMLTPFLRVAASMFYFLFALKNWKYTLFTSVVLAVLTYSLFLR